MNRTELAEQVASKTGLDKRQSEAAVNAVTESIISEIKAGNRVSIFGFGSFDPQSRAARTARNPQTQQTVRVPASKTVKFKPAAAFKETLNTRGRASKKAAKAPAKKAAKAPARKTAAARTPATRTPAKKAAAARATKAVKATRATKKR